MGLVLPTVFGRRTTTRLVEQTVAAVTFYGLAVKYS